MARPLRIEYEGAFYHVTARGNERRRIFFTKYDYEKFKEYLEGAQDKYGYLLHVYVLMSNHYHLVIETPNANMSKIMHYINGSYTNYINRKRNRSGHLFQGRYKAILVDRDNYLLELSRYIHLNPVRAKIVERPEDYSQSSYKSYVFKKKESAVYRDQILGMIANDSKAAPKRYREFVENGIGNDLENPLSKIYGGAILGGTAFIKEALNKLKDGDPISKETSYRNKLKAVYQSDEIISAVSEYFGVSNDAVIKDKSEIRNISIYLMKKITGMTNNQIGLIFDDLSYSGVAKAYKRMSIVINNKRATRKMAEDIKASLS